ncbi:MAG: SDR family NAD(P)-dependent oxidoreductase [Acidobacteriota bacterium]|nr:SDR family NAD(P)-dependent oxidoreductase [Acidobacteriota bacterium]MDQ5839330.1 SDR family NAD(P)-dependent oxidoreductase [Acidobacteriota bacterium]
MAELDGKVSVVTGASRGVGKGVALGLAEAGASVYATGRTVSEETFAGEGRIRPIRCDHREDGEVETLFRRVFDERGHLDVLVNNVWGGYERMVEGGEFTWTRPFWEQPVWRWDAMFTAGVRAHYVASRHAARQMVEQRGGLIVNISFWAAQKHVGNVAYGVSKAATDKLTADMAHELRRYGVAVISLYPGLVRTEAVMQAAAFLDLSNSESPQFIGRAVAALASDPNVLEKSGRALVAAALAEEYGFADVDGKRPRPLTLEEV